MNKSLSRNADQFKQSFREEAREILVELESALLELNENRSDLELVGRIFRGLHTLKGSGSMFGFEKLAAFTHDLETAFDEVRNGRLSIGSELIDLTLSALDQVRAMLNEDDREAQQADPAACAKILINVRRLTGISASSSAEATNETAPDESLTVDSTAREWLIHFAPGPELMLCGANPLLLVRELRQLGSLTVKTSMALVPSLGELDPERCYVSWDMVLSTAAGEDAIRDVFIFVEDCCDLKIEPVGGAATAEADITAKALAEKRATSGGRRDCDSPDTASSIRVAAAKLDSFVNLVGELVTVQARLSELAATRDDGEVSAVAEDIERLASALRENSMNMRMTPIRGTFQKFRRLVHDLARDLNKEVELIIEGAETELDKSVIDQLSDPLMHLIRNSMDHGVESRQERVALGKPMQATIRLTARYSGASVLISVSDDGRGINPDAVRARALERGLIGPDATLSDSEIYALIFQPGFSTAMQVTDVSGRGVGLDVVRRNIDKLRGSIEVTSKPGQGATITLRLPLTMAIIDGLLVSVDNAYFVLPLATTLECIELTRADVERANGKHLANVRGELIPYIRLRQHFNIRTEPPQIEQVLMVDTGEGRYGLVVDRVLGNCQTVIKSLGPFYRNVQVASGATILGNGIVALILDPERLVRDAVHGAAHCSRGQPAVGAARDAQQTECATPLSRFAAETKVFKTVKGKTKPNERDRNGRVGTSYSVAARLGRERTK